MTTRPTGHPCAWCAVAVVSDGHRGWLHIDGVEVCRDERGHVLAGRYAFPRTPDWPLVTNADFPRDGRLPSWWAKR